MDMILILAILLVILVALLAAALLIPADISIRPFKEGPLAQLCVSFRLLKGVSSGRLDVSTAKQEFRLRVLGVTILTKDLKKTDSAKKEKKKKEEKEKPTDWKKLVWNANELYDAGMDLVGALAKNTSIKRLRGKVKVGLSDPAHTGMLVGFLYAGSGIAKAVLPESELEIEIEPSFDKERMDADIETELRLPLFKVVIPLIRFFHRVRTI
uniref:DUF2953 domain-containing protein n=1 Tax=Candidatus Methanophaga sp. ANME-1 ERB7 TaxID=2759913 RepID=A0A7G9Z8F1_9EURY|nr:hypothetical protein CNIFIPMI_00027 [Methanosarcinales archaeon ANME-1 ERB7]